MHSFNYGVLENAPFTFAAGETRTCFITFYMSATVGNDLRIYLNGIGSFNDVSKVTPGVAWGSSQAGKGRTNKVVNGSSAWAENTDFVPTASVPAGHTIQLLPGSPPSNTSASRTIAPSNSGKNGAPVSVELGIRSGPEADEITLV